MLRAPADSITVTPAIARRGTRPRARRQVDFAPLRACSPRSPTASRTSAATHRRRLRRHARLPARRWAWRSARPARPRRDRRPRPRRPARAGRAARRRQLGDHDAAAVRDPRGTPVPDRDQRRRLAAAPAHAAGHRAAHADGRADRVRRRPAAADHRRRRRSTGSSTNRRCRAPRSRAACCWPACTRPGRTRVVEPAPTRDHTERALEAFGVTVDPRRRGRRGRGRPAARGAHADGAGRHLERRVLGRAGRRHPGAAIEIEGVGLNPTRTAVLDVLRRAGAGVDLVDRRRDARANPSGRCALAFGECDELRDRARARCPASSTRSRRWRRWRR